MHFPPFFFNQIFQQPFQQQKVTYLSIICTHTQKRKGVTTHTHHMGIIKLRALSSEKSNCNLLLFSAPAQCNVAVTERVYKRERFFYCIFFQFFFYVNDYFLDYFLMCNYTCANKPSVLRVIISNGCSASRLGCLLLLAQMKGARV